MKTAQLFLWILPLFLFSSCIMIPPKVYKNAEARIMQAEFQSEDHSKIPFLLITFKTPKEEKFPLIVAIHGSGQTGMNYLDLWKEDSVANGYMVLAPTLDLRVEDKAKQVKELNELIDSIIKKYPVDSSRIFLGGASAGANMVGLMMLDNPKRWRGVVLVAAGNSSNLSQDLDGKNYPPILFVHGEADERFPFEDIQKNSKILKEKGFDVEVVSDPILGHTHDISWNEDIFKWLKKHSQDSAGKTA